MGERTDAKRRLRVLAAPATSPDRDNPYVHLLYGAMNPEAVETTPFTRRRLLERWDIVHVHWPDLLIRHHGAGAFIDAAKVILLLAWARLRGAALVWTGHDLEPHEHTPLVRAFFALFLLQVDLVVVLSGAGSQMLRDRHRRLLSAPSVVTGHGLYDAWYPPASADRAAVRRRLGLPQEGRVLLVLGHIRPYKNVDGLVEAFTDAAPADATLAVAGEVKDARLRAHLQARAGEQGVVCHLEAVPDAEVADWMSAADVAVLAYRRTSALTSGAAHLAFSFGRPVVLTDTPVNRELQATVGPDWVRLCDGSSADAIAAALSMEPPVSALPTNAFDWSVIAEATVDAYRRAIAERRFTR